ncbi:hypothetical protein AR543_05930 [Paenibacillus bovis]|uniref:Uncharacterized protein n=2 Tax=Paenibacillus bovis TaxID=1616788 RepID=A0A172ZDA0_9BACL|nr:hypothetical protein AR543_05930 [Paenibacillus bovis]
METDNIGAPQAWYVYGMGLIGREDAAGNYQTYHYDLRGSTMALTDAQGQVTDTYGEQLEHEGASQQPFQYNGRDGVQTDANGLYQMRARYYNPEIKRFVNRDVLTGSIDNGLTKILNISRSEIRSTSRINSQAKKITRRSPLHSTIWLKKSISFMSAARRLNRPTTVPNLYQEILIWLMNSVLDRLMAL